MSFTRTSPDLRPIIIFNTGLQTTSHIVNPAFMSSSSLQNFPPLANFCKPNAFPSKWFTWLWPVTCLFIHTPKYLYSSTSFIPSLSKAHNFPLFFCPTTSTPHLLALNRNFHLLAYLYTTSNIHCNSLPDSAIRTISSAKKHAPIHGPVTFTPNPRLSNSSAKSIKKREKSDGDKIQPCLRPSSIVYRSENTLPTLTLAPTSQYKFWHTLKNFPSIPYSFIFSHKPSLQTLGNAFLKSKNAIHLFLPWLNLICPIPLTTKTWSVVLLFLLKPPWASPIILLSITSDSLAFSTEQNTFPMWLPNVIYHINLSY